MYDNISECLSSMGQINITLSRFDEAYSFFKESYSIDSLNKDYVNMSSSLINIGNVFLYQGKYDLAIETFLKSVSINRELVLSCDKKIVLIAKKAMTYAYNNIGNVNLKQKTIPWHQIIICNH
ncbi:MAG: hypothetical protein Kow0068_16860 [Marinilabiliales bacterium]